MATLVVVEGIASVDKVSGSVVTAVDDEIKANFEDVMVEVVLLSVRAVLLDVDGTVVLVARVLISVVGVAVRDVLVLGDVVDVEDVVDVIVVVVTSVIDVVDADVLVSDDVVTNIDVVVIELVVENIVVLVADVVVAVVEVEESAVTVVDSCVVELAGLIIKIDSDPEPTCQDGNA